MVQPTKNFLGNSKNGILTTMKNISYYILGVVVLGIAIVSFWIYQKYLEVDPKSIISFEVTRGDLQEEVTVRGEVVAQKEYELEFPFGGTIEKIFVKEGSLVGAGDSLIKLETTELNAEYGRLNAVLAEQRGVLSKLVSGTQIEEINISEAKVVGAEQVLNDSKKTLVDAVSSAFTLADDAVHNKADQFFDNARSANPLFKQAIADTQIKINIETERYRVELMLGEWRNLLPKDTLLVSLDATRAQKNLAQITAFLADLATAVNSISPSSLVSQTTIDAWKASVILARTTVDGAVSTLTLAEEKFRTAESALTLAQSQLTLAKSSPRSEDVAIAEARIDQTQHALDVVNEKIRKSTLRAPSAGTVKKIMLESQEIFKPGTTALLFANSGFKIQSDVSELDISKVSYAKGNEALIQFDALEGEVFKGEVISIEPKEIMKDGDVYFRTDILLNQATNTKIRSGMSADVVLFGVKKKEVLLVPALAIEKKDGTSFVKISLGAKTKEEVNIENIVESKIVTGISDGEIVEVLSGVNEGDIVVVVSE